MDKHKEQHSFGESTAEAISKSEQFIEKNKKSLLIGILAILVIIGAIIAYKYLYKEPRVKKAQEEIFMAEHYFAIDSFAIALNGNGVDMMGFQQIIDKYGSTPSANAARAYAGICLYHMGKYEEAEKQLRDFKSSDEMVSPAVIGLVGDCLVEREQYEEAVDYFIKAADKAKNEVISPIYLKKAATVYKKLNKRDKALECYKKIKEDYYNSQEAQSIEKYIQEMEF